MADLKTNYVDDKLDSSKNQLRKYQQIQNDDGTVSFIDVTEYKTTGTSFGALDVNNTNKAVNHLNADLSELNIKMDSAEKSIATKQDASTAITTSNISDQSVKYANSAGSASAATKAYQDGNGANIASTYLKGTQNNSIFLNRPSVNIGGTIVPLVVSAPQGGGIYPITQLYVANNPERLIIKWYADGNLITSYIAISRA